MSLDSLTPDEIQTLNNIHDTLKEIAKHFRYRDLANAQLHLTTVKWSPITKAADRAARNLNALFTSENSSEVSENETTPPDESN
jgi:hypothetical protein